MIHHDMFVETMRDASMYINWTAKIEQKLDIFYLPPSTLSIFSTFNDSRKI